VGRFDEAEFRRALDVGYQSFIVPHIRNAAQVEEVIRATRYHPRGCRGVGPGRPIRFGLDDPLEYSRRAEEGILIGFMIEHVEAVEDIANIVAVDGVELVHLGMWDLSMSYGLPFQERHPCLKDAAARVLDAAQARGVWTGIPPVSPEDMSYWESRGMRFFEVGSATGLLATAARSCAERFSSRLVGSLLQTTRAD
jgi:4-hydroxy-2-oxoheptanedioate aldolase